MSDEKNKAMRMLSPKAQKILAEGRAKFTVFDARDMLTRTSGFINRLSKRIERDTGDSIELCIAEVDRRVATETAAQRVKLANELAANAAKEMDRAFEFEAEDWIYLFADAHGWGQSEDAKEAADAWNEARLAWLRLKWLANELHTGD